MVKLDRKPRVASERGGYGKWLRAVSREAEKPRGGAVAEQRSASTGQNRRQALPMRRQTRVTDRVNAVVEAMKPARRHGSSDRALRIAEWTP